MSKKVQKQKPQPRRPVVEEIEPRILYSADFAPGLVDAAALTPAAEQRTVDATREFTQTSSQDAQTRRHELVLVDTNTPDYQKLVDDVVKQAGDGRDVEVMLLDSSKDGIQQITDILAARKDLSAVHLISHGADGQVQLGTAQLDFDTLLKNATQIRGWGKSLTADADLLIYGCNVAQQADGKALVDALAKLTGADVAASENLTGAAAQGGDWNLEYRDGQIDTQLAVSATEQGVYDRTLAIINVSNLNDTGAGSLRNAITSAAAGDTIRFTVAGTITPLASALPTITKQLTIDATTAPGWAAGKPVVELNGASAGGGAIGLSLGAGSSGSTIRGLAINRFTASAIQIQGSSNNVISGNFLGTNLAGTAAQGNQVGVFVAGTSTNNLIGGTTAAARNIISGNTVDGIQFFGAGVTSNTVQGNYIGLNAAGTASVKNTNQGIGVFSGSANNTIGGTAAGARNVISGNGQVGLRFTNAGTTGNVVQGNYIGTDATGTIAIGNGQNGTSGLTAGIYIGASANTQTIGGTVAGAGNVISGNVGSGLEIDGTTGSVVRGNYIGTNAAGTAGVANGRQGVWIDNAAANNSVGGMAAGAGNTIAYNTMDGVALSSSAGTGNAVLGNAIFSNTGLGIDLHDDNVTANDGAKTAGQPNLLMDFPVIQSVSLNGTTLTLAGYIGMISSDTDFAGARVEFFKSSDAAGANGEGQVYLGFLTADASGNFSGTLTVSGLALGDRVSATATDGSNNTSEFGVNVAVVSTAPVATNDAYSVNEDGTLTIPLASDWWSTSWTQRKQLTFNNTAQAENLTNFAVLVKLDNTRINYALTQNAGQDLRFVDGNGTLLAHEIETWNESGTSYVWVSVPQIDASSGTDYIWMYYGNAAAPDAQNADAVWDAGFSGVWHLNTDELDSAGTNDGINSNSTNGAGVIGSGQSFNGVNGQVYTTTQFVNPQQFTIEAWFRTTSASGAKILGFENLQTGTTSANWDRHLYIGTNGRLYFGAFDDNLLAEDAAVSTTTYTDGIWHHAVGVRNDATNTLSLYVDGALVDTSANATSETYNGYWRMGGYKTGSWPNGADDYFSGSIDEARVSTQVRSAAWVKAQYLSMTDAFVSFGAAQGIGVLGNDSDPNGDPLTAVLVSGPSNAASFTLNANGTFSYTPTANFSGTDTFTYRANDGTSNSNVATVTLTVNPFNDAPVNTVPAAQVTSEDTALVFSSGNGNRISIADVDAASGAMRLTLTATNGTLTLAGVAGLSFTTGDGTADASMTFTGTVANINTALNGLAFAPTANYAGAASVAISASDQGNTGSGGTLTDSDTVNITVNAANDAPTATITPASYAATEQTTLTLHGTGLSIADIDAGAASVTATVSVTTGALSASAGSTGVTVGGSGTATVTLTGTITQINNLLAGASSGTLTYLNSSDAPAASATLTLSVNDGGNTGSGGARSGSDTATINIAAVNDAPTATIVPASYNATEQTTLTLHGTGMSLADPDAGASSITATVSVTAGTLSAGVGTNGVTVSGSGTATVTLTGARAEINNLLSGANGGTLTYVNSSDAPAASATLTLSVNDGGNTGSGGPLTSSDTAVINISAVNDAPVNSVPGAQSTNEDTPRVFSSGNGNQISITDADAASSTMQVTLTATNGRVTLAGTTGLTITAGADGSATVTFTGTAANINTALNGLAYTPTANFNGAASLQIATSDLGNTGSGGALTDTDTVSITVNAIDDPIGTVSDANAAANSVAENAAVGTLVGITAVATDPDTTDTVTYSLDVSAGGRFAINSATGVVTVAGALDREAAASHSITVRATSSGGGFSTQAFTINLTDVDEFDVGAISDANAAANSVAENAAVGTLVGITASASDADATTNAITYSLDNNAGGRFAINGGSGVVTVAGALDREAAASHGIVVRATSADGSFSTQAFTVNLTDVDEFDVGAISDINAAANSVAENAAVGTLVGITASASDADATTNTITYTLDNDASGRFAINSSSGVVTVAGALDREAAASHGIVVRATSADGSFSTQAFTVNLTDVDEFDVGAISDANAAANSVAENAAVGTLVGITASASDADATTNTITYSLDNDAGGRFAINASSGVVTVAGALDREAAASHGIVVRATSADGSFSTQGFTVSLTDLDEFDVGAISDANAAANSVAENAAVGTLVGITASASDADATTNTITYTLDNDAGGRFAINASSGVVTVAGALDREAAASHGIVVRATSADGSFSTQGFTISLTDVDEFDVGAISDANAAANSVAENAGIGSTVGITALASDADATTNAITYTLDNDAGGLFAINASSGVMTVAAALDYETATSHNVVVRATSADGSFSAQAFTIGVTNVNDSGVGAISDANAAADSVAESASPGAVVGITALASDPDSGDTVSYTLDDNAGGRFAINASSGVVTVAGALDRESAASHSIIVRATSTDTSFNTQSFTILVADVDEFDVGAISDTDAAADSVAENAAVGTLVGITASASDADATTNTITYSLDNDAGGRFAINVGSGVVTVAGALDREAAASHGIVVRATSADGSFSTQGFTVSLTDVDEFDVGAISDTDAAANSVAENAAVGTLVGITGSASDADAITNTITYTLDNDAGGRFAINASSGVVTVAGALDREAAASHGIVVRATSADGSFSTQGFTIALTDVDEFDVGAISDTDAAADSVAENAAVGALVGITASASDADATTNAITYSLDNDAGGRFAINAGSGVVTVAGALDREAAASHGIVVRATSADGSFSTQAFTVALSDVDEFDVGAISDVNAAADSVAENAAVGTLVGITASASPDADATTNAITYSLDNDAGGRFAINAGSGVVTVAGAFDREAAASHGIVVRATSADGSFSTQGFTVNLTDVDEFDVGAISDANAAADSVAENAAVGTLVGITALASDADATTNAITYSLDNDAGGRFAINAGSGVVTVAGALDREAAASHGIVVRATSADGSFSTQAFTVSLTDVDEFDVGAISDTDAAANSVAENAAVGSLVGITASASDADATTNTITYTLDNDAGGRFAINAGSGVVTVAGALDREAAASHGIVVRATSADGSFSTQGFTIGLTDVDEFDVGAISDTDAGANTVAENSAVGTLVGITASASDADAITNSISYTLDDDAGGRFAIDPVSGVVTVAGALDAEALASHTITVRAASVDGSFSTQVFTIDVGDVDEFDTSAVTDTEATADSVAENAAVGTLVGITASASDADATTNTITYSLDNSAGGRFAVDANTGVVTVAGALDRESAASHSITVRATSADGSSSTQAFTIDVTDVDEFDASAIADTDPAANSVAEDASVGALVGITASASDADATTNAITYSLDDSAGGRFAINSASGTVTVAAALDAEAAPSHNITVRATSADGSFSTQAFSIAVGDVNEFDVGAIGDADAAPDSVTENAAPGTVVGITASAVDADATTNAITYSLDVDAGGRFAIDSASGVVTVVGALDAEAATSHNITVRATSADGSASTQSFTIPVGDVDEFDVGPISDTNGAANDVAEDAAVGALVGITASASDADATTNAITYSLDNDSGGHFAINGSSGVVTVASALDAETATSHNIMVRATSADGSSSTQSFTIAVSDVNEFDVSAVSDADATPDSVAEDATVGTLVGITASAVDADVTVNTVSYSLDLDAGGRFAIDSNTGVVTLAAALDAETATSHTITVRATSADGSATVQSFTIAVGDVDEFNVGAIVDTDAAADTVAEDAVVGTVVGITASAADADATSNTITYTLDADAGGRFAIDGTTGVVTVAGVLDAETATAHNITVRATSADGSASTQVFSIGVTDVDEFAVGAISDVDGAADAVAEDAAPGTLIGVTASAVDADATNNAITYSLDNDAGGRFAIDSGSGVVTLAGALDAEIAISHTITVRASSADGSFSTRAFNIVVTDIDEFDLGPISDSDAAVDAVDENAAVGTVVGITGSAFDADATNNTVTYTLTDDAGGLFAIDSVTGVVTVAGAIDAELASSHTISVEAASSDGSVSSEDFVIGVNDLDEFDVGPVSDIDLTPDAVDENAVVGTSVGILAYATDDDATNYAITYSLDNDGGGRFAIDAATGEVTVAGALDREAAALHAIIVRATSADGSFSTQGFTIDVNDVDEFDVGAISDVNAAADSVAENAAVGTLVGITASASDADATTNAITYTLDNDAGGRFAINAGSGVVTVAGALDREAAASHGIVVRATSADGSFSTQAFTVSLTDVDEFDVGAISDTNAAADSVAENAAVGTLVGITASGSDADATNNTITYTLDIDAGGRFAIDGTTGVVTVAGALDRESAASHGIVVRATSADGSFSTQGFTIGLTDVDEFDVGAISDTDAGANTVAENSAVGTLVGITASASDADATTNAITYSLDNSAGGRFAIDGATGVVTVAGALDAETAASHNIVVRATSLDGSFSTQTFTIGVTDVDEFGVGAISDTDAAVDSVAENAAVGTVVGITASASDPDATTNTITYTLDNNAGGRFAVDSVTGVVTVAGALDREAAASHGIVVRATSADGSFSTQAFTVALNDVDEFDVGAISDTDAAADSVAENAAVGTLVGITASASDADATTNTITYSLDISAGGRFAIDSATGVVTVAGALDAETAVLHNIVVRATSADGSFSTQAYGVAVTDVDEFDVGAVSDADASANAVAENAVVGTAVGITASAADADASSNAITYSLDNSSGGLFAVDSVTGVVTVAGGLDAETATSHGIVVRATSADGSFSTQGFTIAVADVNEFGVGPITDANAAADSVAENAAPGTLVGITAVAIDADATTNAITYSLDVDAGGRFAIDANTGVVTVAGALDAEVAASHNIAVRATSADGSFSTQALTVSVADVNEAPVINNQVFGGPENSANATIFGSIAFSDQDVGDTATYTITAGNLGGAFSIDALGQLQVANSAALDFETTPSFSLTVQVQDGAGLTDTATVTVNLSGVNEAPALASNTLTVTQGGSVVVSPGYVTASDVDSAAAQLVFTVSGLAHGHFELVSVPGVAVATFTQAEINAGQVRFVHDGSSIAPAFDLSVSDGSLSVGPVSASITFGAAVLPMLPPAAIPAAPATPPAPPEPASVSERPVAAAARAPVIPAVFSPGRIDPPDAQVNDYQPQPLRPGRAFQPVATLNHFTPGPHIDPTMELLAAGPANLQYLSTVPVDWHVRPAFPDAEETPPDRIDVLLEQVQMGGMALSVGVVWWASRISGLLGSLLASAPAWRHIDPLPVVGRDEDEEKKWYDPNGRDVDADELAVANVLEGGHAAGDERQA